MNIRDLLLNNQNSDAISQFANNFGVSEDKARDAIGDLAASLSKGLGHHIENKEGLDNLLDALKTGNHSRYLDNPDLLEKKKTREDGNSILGHIFGNKDVSRHVAKKTAEKTGLGSSMIKKMLPIVAAMVMASLGKKMMSGSKAPAQQESGGLLSGLLDADKDGSVIDDVLGMAFKAAFK